MTISLESHASLLKGYLLAHQTPAEIMASLDKIMLHIKGSYPIQTIETKLEINCRVPDNSDNPNVAYPITKPKRIRPFKLHPDLLPEIQVAHDAGESNGSIGKRHNVSDQTIVNFLQQHGRYQPQAKAGRPAKAKATEDSDDGPAIERSECGRAIPVRAFMPPASPVSPPPAPIDALGEPLHTPKASKLKKRWCVHLNRYVDVVSETGPLRGTQLVEIHDMLSKKMSTKMIAAQLGVTKDDLEAFILKHQNVQITKIESQWAQGAERSNHLVKPAMGGRATPG